MIFIHIIHFIYSSQLTLLLHDYYYAFVELIILIYIEDFIAVFQYTKYSFIYFPIFYIFSFDS